MAPTLKLDQRIPLSDGVLLAAVLASPPGPGPFPTLLTITPYGVDFCLDTALRHAEAGFAYLVVECRGRGESGGHFAVYGDAPDSVEAIAWAAAQPWSTGRVALQGGSYAGLIQWAIAALKPPALTGILPIVAPMPGHDSDAWNGIIPLYDIRWAAFVSGQAARPRLFGNDAYWRGRFADHARSGAPSRALMTPLVVGDTFLETMISNPRPGPHWDFARPTPSQFANIHLPALSISGTADNSLRGAIRYFEQHDAHAPDGVRRHLVIGPWNHGGARLPLRLEDEGTGDDPLADPGWSDALEIAWHRHLLEGTALPDFLTDKVAVYVSGAERWAKGPSLAALCTDRGTLHLVPGGEDGRLAAAPGAGSCTFRYDPQDFRYAELEASAAVGDLFLAASGDYPFEDGFARHLFGQGVLFLSEPLAEPMTILGVPELTLSLETDVPDSDLMFALQAILPDGRSLNLSADFQRLRYRDGPEHPERLMVPGQAETVRFAMGRLVARQLPAGARLRVVVRALASIYLERHRNAAGPVADQTMADARVATFRLHAEGSRLTLPLAASGC